MTPQKEDKVTGVDCWEGKGGGGGGGGERVAGLQDMKMKLNFRFLRLRFCACPGKRQRQILLIMQLQRGWREWVCRGGGSRTCVGEGMSASAWLKYKKKTTPKECQVSLKRQNMRQSRLALSHSLPHSPHPLSCYALLCRFVSLAAHSCRMSGRFYFDSWPKLRHAILLLHHSILPSDTGKTIKREELPCAREICGWIKLKFNINIIC